MEVLSIKEQISMLVLFVVEYVLLQTRASSLRCFSEPARKHIFVFSVPEESTMCETETCPFLEVEFSCVGVEEN